MVSANKTIKMLMEDIKDKEINILRKALKTIREWDYSKFPETGITWEDGTPMSYSAAYGSNGERDYMREIANKALKETE